MSTERPVIFQGPMVRAILEGRKTQTRRVIAPPKGWFGQYGWYGPHPNGGWWWCDGNPAEYAIPVPEGPGFACPYGAAGDLLWVRETWRETGSAQREDGKVPTWATPDQVRYHADDRDPLDGPWRSPIHMPRWASRLTLRILEVRVQRVQEITEADALAEGIRQDWRDVDGRAIYGSGERTIPVPEGPGFAFGLGWKDQAYSAVGAFHWLWDAVNAKRGYGWEVNPWVWALTFERAGHAA